MSGRAEVISRGSVQCGMGLKRSVEGLLSVGCWDCGGSVAISRGSVCSECKW